jgi:hypothetical protein
MAMAMTRPERAVTSWMLERVFSYLRTGGVGFGSLVAMHDDGEGFVDEGVGAVLHLAGGVAFGVDVGDLLELERAFEGDGEVDAAAEEEEVVGGGEDFGLASCSHWADGAEDAFDFAGDAAEHG